MRLFMGKLAKVVEVGGLRYLWYFIWFLGEDINWDIVLSPAPVAIFILFCFSLSNLFYIFNR